MNIYIYIHIYVYVYVSLSTVFSVSVYHISSLMRPRRWFVTSVRSAAGAIQVFGFTTRRGHLELSRFGSKRRDTWFLFLSILSCRNPSPIRLQSHDPAVRPPSPAAFTRPPRPRRRPPSPLLLGCSAAGPAGGSDRRVASPSPPAAAPLRDRPYRCLARVATTHRLFLTRRWSVGAAARGVSRRRTRMSCTLGATADGTNRRRRPLRYSASPLRDSSALSVRLSSPRLPSPGLGATGDGASQRRRPLRNSASALSDFRAGDPDCFHLQFPVRLQWSSALLRPRFHLFI